MESLKNCVVAVFVDGKPRGTGFIVAGDLILTCAHVLTDGPSPPVGKVAVRFHCDRSQVDVDVSEEGWSPIDEQDIAVLIPKWESERPRLSGLEYAPLGRSHVRRNQKCELFGYPDVSNMDGLGGRATVIEMTRTDDDRELLQLESKQATCGYSGSPLFDPVSKTVIGMAVEIVDQARARYAPKFRGRLDDLAFAIPMEVLERIVPGLPLDPEEDAVQHKEVQERVKLRVSEILAKHPDATTFLAKNFDGAEELREDKQCSKVTEYLLCCSLNEFTPMVLRGFTAHFRSNPDVAIAFRELATYIFPQIYQTDFLRDVRRCLNRNENFLQIPGSHRSIVDLVVAGVLGTKLQFDGDWNAEGGVPYGKLQIPMSPEFGILSGDSMSKFFEAFERAIMQKVGGLPSQMQGDGAQTRAINRTLERRSKGDPPIRYYYVYGSGQSRMDELEQRYPHVVFIDHEVTDYKDEEFDILDCLSEMFCPKDL